MPPRRLALLLLPALLLGSAAPAAGSECYTKKDGTDYRGSVAKTRSGLTCLTWKQKLKSDGLEGYFTGSAGASARGVGDHNHCRNPTNGTGAYCFTTKTGTRSEMCAIGDPKSACDTKIAPKFTSCFDAGKATDLPRIQLARVNLETLPDKGYTPH